MKLFKSTRLRWPTILTAAIVILAVGYLARELMQLRDVQSQFDHEWRNWQSFRNSAENVVLTSARLKDAEAAAPWITEDAARERHLHRMEELLESVESPPANTPPQATERDSEIVRREIDKFGSSSGFDP
jgi:hypothetical protein